MKKSIISILLCIAVLLTGCANSDQTKKFISSVETFCRDLQKYDAAINEIDVENQKACNKFLSQIDNMEKSYRDFSQLDFPKEYDYLEKLADQASDYMSEAQKSFHAALDNDTMDLNAFAVAKENYSRAYKRINIITAFLRGENPEDVTIINE